MIIKEASKNIGARVICRRPGQSPQWGVITGIWSARRFIYVRFDGRNNAAAVDAELLELEQTHQPEGINA